jgi:uncharacterized protein (TIGR02757 family)
MLFKKGWAEADLKSFLDEKADQYNNEAFIALDPISIPHKFSNKQDIEISGLWAATLAWGQRVTIIKKCEELLALMDNAPYEFITQHEENDLKPFLKFKHRTFNAVDALYFIEFLKQFYARYNSLEEAFIVNEDSKNATIEAGLVNFHRLFFSLEEFPVRTMKHVSTPVRKSACKRLNMYLRWMVRKDGRGVDFGLWNKIKPSQLICPCDLHVDRIARQLGLITRKQTDWQTALELTDNLKRFDPDDPVKYDFALFGIGVMEKNV